MKGSDKARGVRQEARRKATEEMSVRPVVLRQEAAPLAWAALFWSTEERADESGHSCQRRRSAGRPARPSKTLIGTLNTDPILFSATAGEPTQFSTDPFWTFITLDMLLLTLKELHLFRRMLR